MTRHMQTQRVADRTGTPRTAKGQPKPAQPHRELLTEYRAAFVEWLHRDAKPSPYYRGRRSD